MFTKILVALDIHQSESAAKIVETVGAYFSDAQADVHLVTVVPHDEGLEILSQFIPEGFEQSQMDSAQANLSDLASSISAEIADSQCHVRRGNVYVEVLDLAENIAADLIVLGANRPELKSYLLGPSAARIMRHAACSVFIVRNQ